VGGPPTGGLWVRGQKVSKGVGFSETALKKTGPWVGSKSRETKEKKVNRPFSNSGEGGKKVKGVRTVLKPKVGPNWEVEKKNRKVSRKWTTSGKPVHF